MARIQLTGEESRSVSKQALPLPDHATSRQRPRAHLLASSILTGGTLRSLAVAAGMMTVLGVSPALAQCFSGAGTDLGAAGCQSVAATGLSATAIGQGSTAI